MPLSRVRSSPLLVSCVAHGALLLLLSSRSLPGGQEARAATVVSVELHQAPPAAERPIEPIHPTSAIHATPVAAPRPAQATPASEPALPAAEPEGEGVSVPAVAGEGPPAAAPTPVPAGPTGPATPPGGAAQGPSKHFDLSGYLSTVQARVARNRHYPELALQLGEEGTVEVMVRLAPSGALIGAPVVARSSGHSLLDSEALRIVARAAPFPAHTAGDERGVELRVPVHFEIAD